MNKKILVIGSEVWNDPTHSNNVVTQWFGGYIWRSLVYLPKDDLTANERLVQPKLSYLLIKLSIFLIIFSALSLCSPLVVYTPALIAIAIASAKLSNHLIGMNYLYCKKINLGNPRFFRGYQSRPLRRILPASVFGYAINYIFCSAGTSIFPAKRISMAILFLFFLCFFGFGTDEKLFFGGLLNRLPAKLDIKTP